MAESRPVAKVDAELDGPLGVAQEVVLVEPEQLVEQDEHGNRRFAHADRANVRRLDELNAAVVRRDDARQRRRSHPAGGAAPDDDDLANAAIGRRHAAFACARQFRAMNCACVGMASAAAVITRRMPASLCLTASASCTSASGSQRCGRTCCPMNTATQLGGWKNS